MSIEWRLKSRLFGLASCIITCRLVQSCFVRIQSNNTMDVYIYDHYGIHISTQNITIDSSQFGTNYTEFSLNNKANDPTTGRPHCCRLGLLQRAVAAAGAEACAASLKLVSAQCEENAENKKQVLLLSQLLVLASPGLGCAEEVLTALPTRIVSRPTNHFGYNTHCCASCMLKLLIGNVPLAATGSGLLAPSLRRLGLPTN
jgi:hypothetical protein